MISLKLGVDIIGIQPEIVLAIQIAHEVYQCFDANLVISSVADGKHMVGSLHETGMAVDFRLPRSEIDANVVSEALKAALGKQFDVVLEGNHIHVEFDPK